MGMARSKEKSVRSYMRGLGSFKRLIVMGFSLITIAFETLIYGWFWLTEFSIAIRPHLWFSEKGHYLAIAVYALLIFTFSSIVIYI